jgi:hypothetical protein
MVEMQQLRWVSHAPSERVHLSFLLDAGNFFISSIIKNKNMKNRKFAPLDSPVLRKARIICEANIAIQGKIDPDLRKHRQFSLPSQEQERKSGSLQKLSANGDNGWHAVMSILTDEAIFFSPMQKLKVFDCIPINEISDICAFDDSVQVDLKSSESGPAWSRTYSNLERLDSLKASITFPFAVYTALNEGYNGNRTYFLRTDTETERMEWIEAIADVVRAAYNLKVTDRSRFRRVRFIGRKIYSHQLTQKLMAVVIMSNFVVNCFDSQLQATNGSKTQKLFDVLEIVFTSCFAFELSVNMFLYWFW